MSQPTFVVNAPVRNCCGKHRDQCTCQASQHTNNARQDELVTMVLNRMVDTDPRYKDLGLWKQIEIINELRESYTPQQIMEEAGIEEVRRVREGLVINEVDDSDDILPVPVFNWKEIAGQGTKGAKPAQQHRPVVINDEDDVLPSPVFDWKAIAKSNK